MRLIKSFLVLILFSTFVFSHPSQSLAVSVHNESKSLTLSSVLQARSAGGANLSRRVKSLTAAVCTGDFGQAEAIVKIYSANDPNVAAFKTAVDAYASIQKEQDRLRQKHLDKQLAELKKLKSQAEVNEPNALDIFSVAVRIKDLSSPADRNNITVDAFVKAAVKKSIHRAREFEKKGQWIESLLYCYSWLTILYEDNRDYQSHKKELLDKIIIKSSLTDSPCENVVQRYAGIKPSMFIRAVNVLQYGYVSPFSYRRMAKAAFKRCKNLAVVLAMADKNTSDTVSPSSSDSNTPSVTKDLNTGSFNVKFDKEKIPAFVSGIDKLQSELSDYPAGMSKGKFIQIFKSVLGLDEGTIGLDKGILIAQFVEASLSELDPHTIIVWPKQTSDFQKNMTNEFTGVGIEISNSDGLLKASSLLPGTPAYFSGIDAGDIIEAVNGESTRNMSLSCAVSKITGPAGTKVLLTVRTPGRDGSRDIEITRARIIVPTIRGWSRDDNGKWKYIVDNRDRIGYVKMTSFSGNTAVEFEKVLDKLESKGLDALILDLRYNSGGYLQTAVDVVDMFVSSGIIVSSQPRFGLPSWEPAHKKGTHPDYPLVILINGGSASASEIVAGSLADKTHSRAILVGRRSYGKGSVQTITDYPGGGTQMKYTIAHYHLPNGDKVKSRFEVKREGKKDWGIMPAVEVKLDNEEIKKIFDIQRDNDVLVGLGHDNSKSETKRHDLKETVDSDMQLAAAILVARTEIIERHLK